MTPSHHLGLPRVLALSAWQGSAGLLLPLRSWAALQPESPGGFQCQGLRDHSDFWEIFSRNEGRLLWLVWEHSHAAKQRVLCLPAPQTFLPQSKLRSQPLKKYKAYTFERGKVTKHSIFNARWEQHPPRRDLRGKLQTPKTNLSSLSHAAQSKRAVAIS